jgi:hypothetical protein
MNDPTDDGKENGRAQVLEPAAERRRKSNSSLILGQVVATRGAIAVVGQQDIMEALARHVQGDWGEVSPEDWQENDISVANGYRVLSAYRTTSGTKFWIITEADRSATTVLLPDEY